MAKLDSLARRMPRPLELDFDGELFFFPEASRDSELLGVALTLTVFEQRKEDKLLIAVSYVQSILVVLSASYHLMHTVPIFTA